MASGDRRYRIDTDQAAVDWSAAGKRIGVIGLVPDDWQGIWMPRHYVMSRLARHFEVVWIEPPKGWRDYWLPGTSAGRTFQSIASDEFDDRKVSGSEGLFRHRCVYQI